MPDYSASAESAAAPARARLTPVLLLISGIAALTYEVLWARMLGALFGVSVFGVVFTVTAFMLGLGGGAVWGARRVPARLSALRVFALCEAAVALIALVLPWVFRGLETGLTLPDSGLTTWYGVQGVVATAVLTIPAGLLGYGFSAALRAGRAQGIGAGTLYGVNTVGGALGALLPLGLLPAAGWQYAVIVAAGLGMLTAALAWWLGGGDAAPDATQRKEARPATRVLLAYAGVGAAALMIEIAWTRLYGMVLLRTEYVLAIVLAVFLLGAGAGSLLARRIDAKHLRWLPVAAAVVVVMSLWWLPVVARWQASAQFSSLADAMVANAAILLVITLPATLVLGVWYPLALRQRGDAAGDGAWLYGVNAAGSALGAVIAGVVLIPQLGTPLTLVLAAVALTVCGWAFADAGRWRWALLAPVLLALPVMRLPAVADLQPSAHPGGRDILVRESAIGITHVVEHTDGQRVLLDDLQHMDAASDPAAVASQRSQVRLPLLLHPQPRSVLLLGIGTGISASAALDWPGLQLTGVELSAATIAAARTSFQAVNGGVMDRMTVARDDARRYLRATSARYDVIIGDLFHPDLAGRSSLLSLQQFQYARARLAPNGLFCQWIALNQFDAASLATVLRTFKQVFPDAHWFVEGFRVALVGLNGGTLVAARPSASDTQTGGEGMWTWWGRYLGPLHISPGRVQDEWAPVIEFALPRARYRTGEALGGLMLSLMKIRPEVHDAAKSLDVPTPDYPEFERAYIGTELAVRAWAANLGGRAQEYLRVMRLAYDANPRDRWIGFALADALMANMADAQRQGMPREQALQAVLKLRPDHPEALKALWQDLQAAGRRDEAEGVRKRLLAIAPLDRDVAGAAGAASAVVP